MDVTQPTSTSPVSRSAAPVPRHKGTICFVANEFDGLHKNGGIGTYFAEISRVLARAGWAVHVLHTGYVGDRNVLEKVVSELRDSGIQLHSIDDFPGLPADGRSADCASYLDMCDRVRLALRHLHATHRFDLIEFSEWLALGFRAVQAKRAGVDFQDVHLAVRTHSSSQWLRDANRQWIGSPDEVRLDHCERYAFDHADVQLSPCGYMLDYLRGIGWQVRADARVSFYPFPAPTRRPADEPAGRPAEAEPTEVVFFGRLEIRKGIEVFLDAVAGFPAEVPITFLGKSLQLPDGSSVDLIRRRLPGRRVRILTDYNRERALDYITTGNRVVVIPSLIDNLPFTVIECLMNRVPFVASAVGGIPELFPDPATRRLLFEPTAKALRKCLTEYLALSPADRRDLHAKAHGADLVRTNREDVTGLYADLLGDVRRDRQARAAAPAARRDPVVTIGVPYYNLPDYLPETLASLAAQTYPNLDVVVVNDGSTDPAAVAAFEAAAVRYPEFRFVTQPNAGLGAARNRAIAEARGELFIPVDADNIAEPRMVEVFVRAMAARPDAAALTCYFKAFRETEHIPQGKFPYFYRPTGGPYVLGAIHNVYGDANAVFRTDALRSVAGYELDKDTTCEDWECFVKLVHAGLTVDVVPEFLFYYRHRDESMLRTTNQWRNHQRVLRRYFQDEAAPLPTSQSTALWSLLVSMVKLSYGEHGPVTELRHRANSWHEELKATQAEVRHYQMECRHFRLDAWEHQLAAQEARAAAAAAAEQLEACRAERDQHRLDALLARSGLSYRITANLNRLSGRSVMTRVVLTSLRRGLGIRAGRAVGT